MVIQNRISHQRGRGLLYSRMPSYSWPVVPSAGMSVKSILRVHISSQAQPPITVNLLPGIAFYIQSPAASCADLYKATLAFYKNFLSELEELDEEEFVQMKQGLATQIKERDSSLGARAKRLWLAIGQGDHQFDLNEQIEIALEQLSLKDFIAFFYQLLAPDYDAIFLATGDKPDHSHLTEQNPFNLLEKLPLLAEWL